MFTEVPLLNRRDPAVTAELPLPDVPGKLGSWSDDVSESNEPSLAHVASRAGVVAGRVVWRLQGRGRVVVVQPLASARGGVALRVPARVVPDSVSVSLDEATDSVVVDLVAVTGFLYTCYVPRAQWHDEQPFSADQNWRVIKRPHVFDVAVPRVVVSAGPRLVIVALADGSVLRLDRSDPLAEVRAVTLKDSSAPRGLAAWVRTGADRVPGHPHLSVRSAVSAALVGHGEYLATCSINNDVRLWSLAQQECVDLVAHPGTAPRLRASRFISAGPSDHEFIVALPDRLVTYSIASGKLVEVSSMPHPAEVAGWFVADVHAHGSGVVVAYRSNLSARVYVAGELVSSDDPGDMLALPDAADMSQLVDRLFGFTYAPATLAAALDVYAPNHDSTSYGAVTEAVEHTAAATGTTVRMQWLRLDRLCREIEAQGAELLAVGPSAAGGALWTVRAAYVSVVCPGGPPDSLLARLATETFGTAPSELPSNGAMLLDEIDQVARGIDAAPVQTLRARVQGLDVDALLWTYLNQFRAFSTPDSDSKGVDVGEVGAEALARILAQAAAREALKLRALALFVVVALVEGWVADGVGAYSRIKAELRVCRTIMALQSAGVLNQVIGSPSTLSSDAVGAAWNALDLSGPSGIASYARIIEIDSIDAELLAGLGKDLPLTPAAVFVRGVAAHKTSPDALNEATVQLRSVALVLAAKPVPELTSAGFDVAGKGLSHYYAEASRLTSSLELAMLACQYETTHWQPFEQLLDLAATSGNLDAMYTAILGLHTCNAPLSSVDAALVRIIDTAARQGTAQASMVVRELPFVGLAARVQRVLSMHDVFGAVPSYKLLYAWHVAREDYVGAAQAVYCHITAVRSRSPANTGSGIEIGLSPEIAQLSDLYAVALNALKLVAVPDDRWLVAGARVITYDELRREHRTLLQAMIQSVV